MTNKLRALAEKHEALFGTSGVRGLVTDLSDDVCYAYTQAFLKAVVHGAGSVVIGHDLRPSSPRIAAACVRAIHDAGGEAIFAGEISTPAAAYYSALKSLPCIVVTGSHIPFDRNGIKFFKVGGEISKADEQAILEEMVELPAAMTANSLPESNSAALDAYVSRYVNFFGTGALAGMRVALYEHSSVARDTLRKILELLGARVLSLGRTETFVPIDTEAVRPEDIEQAQRWAVEHHFDAILSTDGDADLPLIGDELGHWMRGDVVCILCAQALGAEVVVTPVSSNTAAEKCGSFKHVLRTRIGSPYVIAGMEATTLAMAAGTIVVGYEANGGFLLGSDVERDGHTLRALPTRDSVLPMLALLTMARSSNRLLSQLAGDLPARFTASDRIQQVPTEWSQKLIETLSHTPVHAAELMAPDAGEPASQDTTDGLRITFVSGDIVHLRPSGNAPEIRCYAESQTRERASALCLGALNRVRTSRCA